MAASTVHPSPTVASLYLPTVVVAHEAAADHAHVSALHESERRGTEAMAPRRLDEYATARAAARASLAAIGRLEPVRRGQRGEPEWPLGVTGSIAHTRGHCLAVAAAVAPSIVIGLDCETIDRVNPAIERRILVDVERVVFERAPESDRQRLLATTFAAKEAFYKAHHQLAPRYLGFDVLAVTVLDDGGLRFAAGSGEVDRLVIDPATDLRGRWSIGDGRVTVGVVVEAGPRGGSASDPSPTQDG